MSATPTIGSSYSDLRSATKDRKRSQDQKHKWAYGPRSTVLDNDKKRPASKPEGRTNPDPWAVPGIHCNLNKARNLHDLCSPSRVRTYLSTKEELKDPLFLDTSHSFLEDLPSRNGYPRNLQEETTKLGHSSDIPFKPVALDSLIRATGKETEQFVQHEFVILDDHGESASGRKARRILRKAEKATDEHDGFELL